MLDRVQDVVSRYRLVPAPGIEYGNAPVERLLGYTPDEIYATPDLLTLAVHPDDWAALQPFGQPGESPPEPVEVRLRHKDGSWVWVELRNVAIRDRGGAVVAVVGVARDITERRAAEQVRRELEAAEFGQAQALEINDNVVQGLVTAKLLLELGREEEASDALDRSLSAARTITTELLIRPSRPPDDSAGRLRRTTPAGDPV